MRAKLSFCFEAAFVGRGRRSEGRVHGKLAEMLRSEMRSYSSGDPLYPLSLSLSLSLSPSLSLSLSLRPSLSRSLLVSFCFSQSLYLFTLENERWPSTPVVPLTRVHYINRSE